MVTRGNKVGAVVAILVAVLFSASPMAHALWVGGNIDVHNNTGLEAYDFHIEGQIKSTTPPSLGISFGYWDGGIPFDSFAHTITPAGGDLWDFKADWWGDDPIPHCEFGHFGLFFQATCRNVWVNLDGWWTGRDGEKIPDEYGSYWPIPGFEVPTHWWDPPRTQVFRLQGDAGEDQWDDMRIEQMDMALVDPPDDPEALFAMLNVMGMDKLNWMPTSVQPGTPVPSGDSFFDVFTELTVGPIGWDQILLTRTLVRWGAEPEGRWVFHAHQAHPYPEPCTLILLGGGLLGLVARRRKRK